MEGTVAVGFAPAAKPRGREPAAGEEGWHPEALTQQPVGNWSLLLLFPADGLGVARDTSPQGTEAPGPAGCLWTQRASPFRRARPEAFTVGRWGGRQGELKAGGSIWRRGCLRWARTKPPNGMWGKAPGPRPPPPGPPCTAAWGHRTSPLH